MAAEANHPVLQLIRQRSSIEHFDPRRSLEDGEIRRLVEDAVQAPSSFNIQHWRFVAVRRPSAKRRLSRAAFGQRQVQEASVTFIVLGDTRGAERLGEILDVAVERGAMPSGKAAAWARMVRTIYADPQIARDEAMRSGSLAAMVLMLAAEARGLASTALSGFDPAQVRELFGIPLAWVPVMLVCVGHPLAKNASRMPRLGIGEVLWFDEQTPLDSGSAAEDR